MSEKEEKLSVIRESVENCRQCGLCRTRTNTVFGRGSADGRVLFVGEAPGENEDRQGLPFVGAAGMLLDRYIQYAGIPENDYYTTPSMPIRRSVCCLRQVPLTRRPINIISV